MVRPREHLLPSNRTTLETDLSLTLDRLPELMPGGDAVAGFKFAPPDAFLDAIIAEYGLGEVADFLADKRLLISDGLRWQRVRGTPYALALGLNWVGYAQTLHEAPTRRRRWNLFHLQLDRVRDVRADLLKIERIANLSKPARSNFWRGWSGYNVEPLEYGRTKWGETLWGAYSGVRVAGTTAKWSFGRTWSVDHVMTEAELTALGVWIPVVAGDISTWDKAGAAGYSWNSAGAAGYSWNSAGASGGARSLTMAAGVVDRPCYLRLLDGDGAVIGYRRPRIKRLVVADASGPYTIGGVSYAPAASGDIILVEALTGFGDGEPAIAAAAELVFDIAPADFDRPGQLWLAPVEMAGAGTTVAPTALTIPLAETIRERLQFLLRF